MDNYLLKEEEIIFLLPFTCVFRWIQLYEYKVVVTVGYFGSVGNFEYLINWFSIYYLHFNVYSSIKNLLFICFVNWYSCFQRKQLVTIIGPSRLLFLGNLNKKEGNTKNNFPILSNFHCKNSFMDEIVNCINQE